MTRLKAIYPRMGGKHFLVKKIKPFFPQNYDTYVEPFFGAGHLFFSLDGSKKEVINDLDPQITRIMKGFQTFDNIQIADDINGYYSKEDFNDIKHSQPSSEYDQFLKDVVLLITSYFGKGEHYCLSSSCIDLPVSNVYKDRLKDVVILNQDYKSVIQQFDSPNSFFYLDPPYQNSSKNHYQFNQLNIFELLDFMTTIQGMFLLSYNCSSEIEEYSEKLGFKSKKITTVYSNPKGGSRGKVDELLISNYFDAC